LACCFGSALSALYVLHCKLVSSNDDHCKQREVQQLHSVCRQHTYMAAHAPVSGLQASPASCWLVRRCRTVSVQAMSVRLLKCACAMCMTCYLVAAHRANVGASPRACTGLRAACTSTSDAGQSSAHGDASVSRRHALATVLLGSTLLVSSPRRAGVCEWHCCSVRRQQARSATRANQCGLVLAGARRPRAEQGGGGGRRRDRADAHLQRQGVQSVWEAGARFRLAYCVLRRLCERHGRLTEMLFQPAFFH